MNKLFEMFLVSDVVNFGDIILDELTAVLTGESYERSFSGNIFDLHITKELCTLSNMLDERMENEQMRTRHLFALVQSEVNGDFFGTQDELEHHHE